MRENGCRVLVFRPSPVSSHIAGSICELCNDGCRYRCCSYRARAMAKEDFDTGLKYGLEVPESSRQLPEGIRPKQENGMARKFEGLRVTVPLEKKRADSSGKCRTYSCAARIRQSIKRRAVRPLLSRTAGAATARLWPSRPLVQWFMNIDQSMDFARRLLEAVNSEL